MRRASKSTFLAMLAVALVAALTTAGAASAASLRATMNGDAERPKGDDNGRGKATITTDVRRGRVCYRITLTGVGSVAAGHIHKGAAGVAGGIVVPLFDKATTRPRGCATGVKKSVIRAIERNPKQYYVNVHNEAYPAGAVRGQLRG